MRFCMDEIRTNCPWDDATLYNEWKRKASSNSKAELLNRIFASCTFCREDTEHRDHSHTSVVELLHSHLVIVHLNTEGVAIVARLLLTTWVLPPCQLQDSGQKEDGEEAQHTFSPAHDGETSRWIFEARELQEMLTHKSNGCHHCYLAALCGTWNNNLTKSSDEK